MLLKIYTAEDTAYLEEKVAEANKEYNVIDIDIDIIPNTNPTQFVLAMKIDEKSQRKFEIKRFQANMERMEDQVREFLNDTISNLKNVKIEDTMIYDDPHVRDKDHIIMIYSYNV